MLRKWVAYFLVELFIRTQLVSFHVLSHKCKDILPFLRKIPFMFFFRISFELTGLVTWLCITPLIPGCWNSSAALIEADRSMFLVIWVIAFCNITFGLLRKVSESLVAELFVSLYDGTRNLSLKSLFFSRCIMQLDTDALSSGRYEDVNVSFLL
jgi:hypothetical protein